MTIEENWAVAMERVQAFFAQQPDVTTTRNGFLYGDCRITLVVLDGQMGPWAMPRTLIRIEGPEAEAKAIYHRFFLRFLSAGG